MITIEQIRQELNEIKSLKPRDTSEATRRSPSDADLERIFNNIEHYQCKHRYRRIFEKILITTLVKTGIRIDEAYNIHLEDINFDNKTLFIRKAKNSKQRTVGLTHSICDELKVYLEERSKLV